MEETVAPALDSRNDESALDASTRLDSEKLISVACWTTEDDKGPRLLDVAKPAYQLPVLLSLVERIATAIASFFTSGPAIIEYTDAEITEKISVQIEARRLKLDGAKDNEEVVCLQVTIIAGVEDNGDGSIRTLDLKARNKRIREIMVNAGVEVAEEVYKEEVREALRRVRCLEKGKSK